MFRSRSSDVIVCAVDSNGVTCVDVGATADGAWRSRFEHDVNVIYWMPMPEPPEIGLEGIDAK